MSKVDLQGRWTKYRYLQIMGKIQVIHLFIIRDKIPYELITDVFLSKFVCTNAVQYIIL